MQDSTSRSKHSLGMDSLKALSKIMMYLSFVLYFFFLVGTLAARDYSGYKVLRVTPPDLPSLEFLRSIEDLYDFWKESKGVGHFADILVSGEGYPLLTSKLKEMGIDVQIMIDDVKPLIDNQMRPTSTSEYFYDKYHTLDEINNWMEDFTIENSNITAKEVLFNTYEGRGVQKIKISSDLRNKTRPIFFVIGGTHSREWISPATMINMANMLVSSYDPKSHNNLIDIMEFHIVPVFNQDGYVYTWTEDRMWRKTRDELENSPCTGTDPNRNWDCSWGTVGSSKIGCSDTYRGLYPASTVEVKSMQDHVYSIKDRVKVFMDVHAYSQFWMYPYGYSYKLPADDEELRAASKASVDAVEAVHGKVYENGPIAEVIYEASGSSADWGYDVAGITHSYALELRDTGNYGFILPESEIMPTAEEFQAGCEALVNYLKDNNGL